MSMQPDQPPPAQLTHEFEVLSKEVMSHQPEDLLQYCANYFNKRLEEERRYARARPNGTGHAHHAVAGSAMAAQGPPIHVSMAESHDQGQLDPHDQTSHPPPGAAAAVEPCTSSANDLFGGYLRNPSISAGSGAGSTHARSRSPLSSTPRESTPQPSQGPSHGFSPTSKQTAQSVSSQTSHQSGQSNPPSAGGPPADGGLFKQSFQPPSSPSSQSPSQSQPQSLHPTQSNHHGLRDTLLQFNAGRRVSVSAEAINPDQFENFAQREKSSGAQSKMPTGELLQRLNKSVSKNFLFSNLEEDSLRLLLGALEDTVVPKGHIIIRQGDEGDYFYIVENGEVEFLRDGQAISKGGPGTSFGELALMYNAPRAATVLATDECKLWRLDRMTFKKILLDETTKKRNSYQSFLQKVPLLSGLGQYERTKLADALKTRTYEQGETVVRQGDPGDEFFLIESGQARIFKEDEPQQQNQQHQQKSLGMLSDGDYFGEVALLHDLPRQATVVAQTRLKVACLGRQGFQRLLGPVLDTLRRRDPTHAGSLHPAVVSATATAH